MSSFAKVLTGYSIIGSVASPTPETIQQVSMVAMGSFADEIKAAAYHRAFGEAPDVESTDFSKHENVEFFYQRVVFMAKSVIRQIFSIAKEEDDRQKKIEQAERMKALASPHPSGTTAEIAQLLGISKAQVRRYKAEGTLDGMLSMHSLSATSDAVTV